MPKKRQINQYTLDGEFIKTWNSLTQASESLGCYNSQISNCCQMKSIQAKGFQWRYTCDCNNFENIGAVKPGHLERRYWYDYDRCKEAAMQCTCRSEYHRKYPAAYKVSLKEDWLDDYTWFQRKPNFYSDRTHTVYGYFFENSNYFYIGRTDDYHRRDWQHKNCDSSVGEYVCNSGVEFPEMTILEDNLTLEESLIYEDMYIEQYLSEGWNKLNKAKTGLGSGAIGVTQRKWTRPLCYAAALECSTKKEFTKKFPSADQASKKNGWFSDYTWFVELRKPKEYWSYDNCRAAASQCKNRAEFQKKFTYAYNKSWKNGWNDEFFPKTKKSGLLAACK